MRNDTRYKLVFSRYSSVSQMLNNFKLPNKIKFIKDLDKRSKNYSSFIKNNLRHDRNELGMNKVIKEIKQLSL